ncbi:hypothetical protein K443DRAFT_484472 [Laccaria amethystina LaAM-08-1]|uniref:Uncharacterized protein n=1 Tax=Laccaria amethystina LaAM-08-1 TaxID=1095629 RepID=A0A0C9XP05_9AGAR|nr:hypothetical protein K443DRAFT_484472 [Laccaria amethystina LaAM-08-1]
MLPISPNNAHIAIGVWQTPNLHICCPKLCLRAKEYQQTFLLRRSCLQKGW